MSTSRERPSLLHLDPAARSRRVKAWAAEIGFDLVGIARAAPLDREGDFLRDWLAEGFHADMEWMADRPSRRIDPTEVLEGCRSVIVLAANYHRPEALEKRNDDLGSVVDADNDGKGVVGTGPRGRIAQYAQRVDYHRTLGKQARNLARRIAAEGGGPAAARWYVDTGPVLEKAWAQRAGIGFVGKNTCLIHKRRGSWFLLGVVLTTLELEPDPPETEGCGACRRCLDACPTGALVRPGVLDSNRCLSYRTIEYRGETMPEELRERFEGWVFGCDICQEVCPYNKKFQTASSEEGILGPYLHPPAIRLSEILEIETPEEFLDKIGRQSPLRRAGLSGMRRNARIVGENKPG